MQIRPARDADLAVLQGIERAAGQAFREIGMAAIADDEPPSLAELARYLRAGRAWVAAGATDPAGITDPAGATDRAGPTDPAGPAAPLAGYLIAEPVDGNLHIEQVSVHPRWARRGVGRRLLEHAATHAAAAGMPALTLTTFSDVPWNGPYYLRCGFRVLADRELTPGLRAIRRREAEHGLDRWSRVCMRRDL